MAKSNTIRKNFSISRRFQEVDKILASLPDSDQSRFICEAILHYSEFKNNPNWLLQQVAPIVQMQQQLSALYPNQGTGYVAQQSTSPAPKELPVQDSRGQNTSVQNENTASVKSNEEKSQSNTKEEHFESTKKMDETDLEHVEENVKEISQSIPSKAEETEDKPPRAARKRSSLSSQFDQ